MRSHHLIKLLSSFERKQMTRFRAFAYSPYHNRHEGVRKLVDLLESAYPAFEEGVVDRRVLFGAIFPGQAHRQNKLAVLFTYTYRLAESFLELEVYRGAWGNDQSHLLRGLREQGMGRQYEKRLERAKRELRQHPERGSDYHLLQYRLAAEADRYYNQQGKHRKDFSIQDKQDQLDLYFVVEKFKDACEMMVRRRILKVEYHFRFLGSALKEVRDDWGYYSQFPPVVIYLRLYELLSESGGEMATVLRNMEEKGQALPTAEQQLIFNYLQNYCIEKINQGRSDFLRDAFSVYQLQLEKQLLWIEDIFPEWHYKNIIAIGLRLGEHRWVEHFLHEYKPYLDPKVADNAYSFNLANFYYSTQRLEEALALLSRISYEDIRYNLGAKALLLRIYFDLDEFEAFVSHAEAFRKYLERNRLLNDRRIEAFRNLLTLSRRVMILKNRIPYQSESKSIRAFQKIRHRFEHTDHIVNRDWLQGKLREMEALLSFSEPTSGE